jgi:hypothetical protein
MKLMTMTSAVKHMKRIQGLEARVTTNRMDVVLSRMLAINPKSETFIYWS